MFKFLAGLGFATALAGCAATLPPVPVAQKDPADSMAKVRPTHPVNSFAGYRHFVPVGPADWKELNRQVTPGGGQ